MKELIAFKGSKEGIRVIINSDSLEDIRRDLETLMKKAYDFYKNTKIIDISSDLMGQEDIDEVRNILKYRYDLIVPEDQGEAEEKKVKKTKKKVTSIESSNPEEKYAITKFINTTLRSGQEVDFNGNVVIIGDVNPGAMIQASGNIIVLGTLRGVVHAGRDGDTSAIVAAYQLLPSQIRIGDKISRAPDEKVEDLKKPEIAKIKNGEFIIEPYLPNK